MDLRLSLPRRRVPHLVSRWNPGAVPSWDKGGAAQKLVLQEWSYPHSRQHTSIALLFAPCSWFARHSVGGDTTFFHCRKRTHCGFQRVETCSLERAKVQGRRRGAARRTKESQKLSFHFLLDPRRGFHRNMRHNPVLTQPVLKGLGCRLGSKPEYASSEKNSSMPCSSKSKDACRCCW